MSFAVVGLSHHSVPVELRERFAVAEQDVLPMLGRLRAAGLAEEAVILSTCNRVELHVWTPGDPSFAAAALREFLFGSGPDSSMVSHHGYVHLEAAGVEHLYRVACGMDSLVLGETEVLGQLKSAYELALQGGFTGRRLNRLFQRAFRVAKQVRRETAIQRGATSVASVAVDLAEETFGDLGRCGVMVIGTGDTGAKAARALQSRGARHLIVSNRTFDRAAELARELGGRALPFNRWEEEFGSVDIVISSTGASTPILTLQRLQHLMRLRPARPLLLIDLAVPRDIDPAIGTIGQVLLRNVDDLQALAGASVRQRKAALAAAEAIISDAAQDFLDDEARRTLRESVAGKIPPVPQSVSRRATADCPMV